MVDRNLGGSLRLQIKATSATSGWILAVTGRNLHFTHTFKRDVASASVHLDLRIAALGWHSAGAAHGPQLSSYYIDDKKTETRAFVSNPVCCMLYCKVAFRIVSEVDQASVPQLCNHRHPAARETESVLVASLGCATPGVWV
jgi:hypothetical protein